jgi:hypothetical protein
MIRLEKMTGHGVVRALLACIRTVNDLATLPKAHQGGDTLRLNMHYSLDLNAIELIFPSIQPSLIQFCTDTARLGRSPSPFFKLAAYAAKRLRRHRAM